MATVNESGSAPGEKYGVVPMQKLYHTTLTTPIGRLGIATSGDDWSQRRDAAFRHHLDSLDDLYYSKGAQRLDALRLWTQGKATRERAN